MGESLSGFWDPPPESFSRDDLDFLRPFPEHLDIECPICLQVMLNDPHIVSCCGHHFCGYCIRKTRSRDDSCPICKTQGYQSMADKGLERKINSLGVKCLMVSDGCQWEGELHSLAHHLAKPKREGECKFAVVECRNKCGVKQSRANLTAHEILECPKRVYQCPHCQVYKSSYENVVSSHVPTCDMVPVECPNGCNPSRTLLRGQLDSHLKKACPLEEVPCAYAWAGCKKRHQRKLAEQHCKQFANQHLAIVAQNTKTLSAKNHELETEVQALRNENKRISAEVKRQAGEIQSLRSEISELRKQTREIRTIKHDVQLLQQRLGASSSSSYYRS